MEKPRFPPRIVLVSGCEERFIDRTHLFFADVNILDEVMYCVYLQLLLAKFELSPDGGNIQVKKKATIIEEAGPMQG